MSLYYWTGVIDGIPLEDVTGDPAAFELAGTEVYLMGDVTGVSSPAISGAPLTLYVDAPTGGRELELRFLHIPAALFQALIDAFTARLAADESFTCSFTDGFQSIEDAFKPALPGWLERGSPDGDYIKDAVLRIVSTGE